MTTRLALKVALAAAFVAVAALPEPAAAQAPPQVQGGSCPVNGYTAGATVGSGGQNLICLSGTWQYLPYQFGPSALGCTSTNAGMIEWTGSAFQGCNGTSWGPIDIATGAALSSLLAATTTNSIDSGNWAQTWKWGTLSTQNALTLTTSSMTTGTLLSLSNSASGSNAGTVLSISNSETGAAYGVNSSMSGAANTGYAGYFTNTGTAGYAGYFNGTVVQGNAALLTTTAISGFMNIAETNGTPVGTPSITSGALPITVDNVGVFYIWNVNTNSWKPVNNTRLSSLTAATATNSLDSKNFAQAWAWGTLSTQTALTLSTSSMTTGTLLNLSDTSASSSAGTVLSISNAETGVAYGLSVTMSGTGNTGYAGYFSNTSTGGWALYAGTAPSYFAGSVGIGTTAPQAALHVNGGAIVGNDAASCTGTNAGEIEWTGSAFQGCNGVSWGALASGGGSAGALSALLAATTTNLIDSANWAQTWRWGTLSSGTALTLTTSSMTTGTLLSLSNAATGNNAGTVLSVSNSETGAASYGINVSSATTGAGYGVYSGLTAGGNTGYAVYANNATTTTGFGVYSALPQAANTGYAGYFSNSATTGWALAATGSAPSYFQGNVGIGTANPAGILDVEGGTAASGVDATSINVVAKAGNNSNPGSVILSAGFSNATGFSSGTGATLTLGGNTASGQFGGNVTLTAGNGDNNGVPGNITLTPGITQNNGGGSLNLNGGGSSANGTGGTVAIAGGGGLAGGSVTIQGGTPTGGAGGSITVSGAAGVGTNKSGGSLSMNAGAATGSGTAGAVTLTGGGAGSGTGGAVTISGGGSTSGAAGAVTVRGGTPTAGNGAAVNVTGSAGVGTNKNGGNVAITAGAATGTGTAGIITLTTTGAEAMRVTATGSIGIGTTGPQATLDVNGYMRLAKNSSQPVACSATNDGAIALTHLYTMCTCKGGSTSWVQSSDGATACSW